jgi:hypothetical protein
MWAGENVRTYGFVFGMGKRKPDDVRVVDYWRQPVSLVLSINALIKNLAQMISQLFTNTPIVNQTLLKRGGVVFSKVF